MPHTECAHRQAQTQISNENPPSLCSAMHLIRPTGQCFFFFFIKSKALHEEQGLHIEMQPIQTPVSISGEGFYYTSQSLSTVWSSVSECQQQHILSFCPFESLRPSLQVSVFEVPVLEGEPLLLPLAPFFIVKVNVSALFKLISDGLRLLVPLEPHHVLGVKPP